MNGEHCVGVLLDGGPGRILRQRVEDRTEEITTIRKGKRIQSSSQDGTSWDEILAAGILRQENPFELPSIAKQT